MSAPRSISEDQPKPCDRCGDTGLTVARSHEDYGVSFESENCDACETGRALTARDLCDYEGHEYADAGGGLRVCLRCEDEEWSDDD